MYYDEIAKGYEELHEEEQRRKVKAILEFLPIEKKDKLLDVGCGTGCYLNQFDCYVIGADPSKELLARNKFPHRQASAEQLPFADTTFDIVLSLTAIHNFDDIDQGLAEMKRVGKKKFALTVLKKSKQFRSIETAIKELFPIVKVLDDPHDMIFLSY